MDATTLLKKDHRKMAEQFASLDEGNKRTPSSMNRIADRVFAELETRRASAKEFWCQTIGLLEARFARANPRR